MTIIKKVAKNLSRYANAEVPHNISSILKSTTEIMTTLVKNPYEVLPALGKVAQRIVAGERLHALSTEYEKLCAMNRVSPEYSLSQEGKYTLLELLNFLDSEMPDENRFRVIKKIFLLASTETKYNYNSVKPREFVKIIKSLSSGSVLVFETIYILSKNPPKLGEGVLCADHEWFQTIASKSGLEPIELVVNYETELASKRLIMERVGIEKRIRIGHHFGLTNLGHEIGEYISEYENLGI